ncbi:MAG: recombinase family protein [Alphaproteobacteria bacterium]|nr:recombinase family protein [Alphaproteobacteria bacterium]
MSHVAVAYQWAERHNRAAMICTAPSTERIAIYARYSSDLQNPSSIDDQVALCRDLIRTQFPGSDQSKVLEFSDAAITGATMERPGVERLLAAAKAKRFSLLLAEGLDRLSRSLKDVAALYETLSYHGVTIWTAHEGRINELHIGLKGTMNALFLRDMKAKVRRGQSARVAAGFSTSSCPYGYRVVRGVVDQKGRTVNGVREIDEGAASVVRRIFQEFADGKSIPAIIAGLNQDGIPAPSGGLWKRNAIAGSRKKQEGILHNEVYVGNLIYNRTRVVRDPATQRKRYEVNPASEWTRTHVPEYRIIDDETWQRVRLRDQPRPPAEKAKQGRAEPRILSSHNQHALTGWVKCGWCGGPKSLANESRYLCSTHRYARKCKNSRGVKEPVLMDAVFLQLRERIAGGPDFRPAFLAAFAREMKRRDDLVKQQADLKGRIERLLAVIERGVNEENVTGRILTLQDELEDVRRQAALEMPVEIPDEATIRASLRQAVDLAQANADVADTRRLFQCVLKQVVLTPIDGSSRGETVAISLREDG